jgi:hypothetical protein
VGARLKMGTHTIFGAAAVKIVCVPVFLAALLACGPAHADDALGAVRAALRQYAGTTPVKAVLERAVTWERKDRPLEAGRVTLDVASGRGGATISYPVALLSQLQAERANPDPDLAKPARRTLENFDVTDVADLLNAAPALLTDLDGATLKADTAVEHEGRPARLLELELVVHISKADRKWVKSSTRSMKLWVTPEGVPLAEQRDGEYVVGLLFFTFDARDSRTQAFGVAGDRLVVLRRSARYDGEGLGESQHHQAEMTLRLQGS